MRKYLLEAGSNQCTLCAMPARIHRLPSRVIAAPFFKSRNRMRNCYNSDSDSRIFCKGWRPKLLVISGTKSRVAADSVACALRRAARAH